MGDISFEDAKAAFKADRENSFRVLKGGVAFPITGALVWFCLGVWGHFTTLYGWAMAAYFASGALAPLGLGVGVLLGTNFFKHRDMASGVVAPALIGMLLFWAILLGASSLEAYELIPLILAIGMSMHWPVIGWSYNRTIIYTAHALVRAAAVLFIFTQFPEHRLTWMPFAVSGAYVLTIGMIFVSLGMMRREKD